MAGERAPSLGSTWFWSPRSLRESDGACETHFHLPHGTLFARPGLRRPMKKHYQSGPFDSDIFGPMEAEVIDKRGLKWYYARCSCGWVGDRYATDSAANEAAWEHYFERQKIEDPRKHLRTPHRGKGA